MTWPARERYMSRYTRVQLLMDKSVSLVQGAKYQNDGKHDEVGPYLVSHRSINHIARDVLLLSTYDSRTETI
jgi:hypothetical protein